MDEAPKPTTITHEFRYEISQLFKNLKSKFGDKLGTIKDITPDELTALDERIWNKVKNPNATLEDLRVALAEYNDALGDHGNNSQKELKRLILEIITGLDLEEQEKKRKGSKRPF